MPQVEIRGIPWNVLDQGAGPVLLMVHGFPLDHTMWEGQIAGLSDHFRLVAPDLCGFGQSGVTDGVTTMSQYADDLARLLDLLSIQQPVAYCGLSMGGYIGWQFWRRHRARLDRLIQSDTRAAADSSVVAKGRQWMAQSVITEGAVPVADSMIPKLFSSANVVRQAAGVRQTWEVIAGTDPRGIAAAQRGMAEREDLSAAVAGVDLPVLLVCGAEDEITPPDEMRSLAAAMPGAQYVEIESAGHMAPLENPAAFNRAVLRFLQSDE